VFSPGPTRDWSLSPDGARLAFVDRLGAAERRYAGRTLVIATGSVSDSPSQSDQLGAAWRPGSVVADFGGPGGTVRLTADAGQSYLMPVAWSPDGETLAATVYESGRDGNLQGGESVELVTPQQRLRISDVPGVRFLGWVQGMRVDGGGNAE
jgi:Tol biopolymer transport system component